MFLLLEKEGIVEWEKENATIMAHMPKDIELDVWKGIYLNDRWIGYVHTNFVKNSQERGGYVLNSFSYLKFKMLNHLRNLAITTVQELDPEYRLVTFRAGITGLTDILVTGKKLGDAIHVEIRYGNTTHTRSFDVQSNDLFLEQSILSLMRGTGLKIGETFSMSIFNPLTMKTEKVTARVVRKERDTTVMETQVAGLVSTAWINPDGLVIKEETPNGWVMKLESEESIDRHLAESNEAAIDIIKETSVRTAGSIAFPRTTMSMRIKITGINPADFTFDGQQQEIVNLHNGIMTISSVFPDPDTAPQLPYEGNELASFLQSSLWIECDDPLIKAKAREIIGDETDSWRAAQKISQWVYRNTDKIFSPGIPSATAVLLFRKGDCNEHTVLFVALARAAGIPAEMSAGIAYLNDGFYYHAWPKVFVGKWVHLDPTFGQSIADATHVELISGDIAAQAKLASIIGKISIEILESRR